MSRRTTRNPAGGFDRGTAGPSSAEAGERGLASWVGRNRWLLLRLLPVWLFAFLVPPVAENVLYAFEGEPVRLSAQRLASGDLPSGVAVGDFVEVEGTPDLGGREEPRVAVASRYEVAYYYFRLEGTGDRLLIQQAEQAPDPGAETERSFAGRLDTVGGVIFHDTTHEALRAAGLPTDESVAVVETGEKPSDYRDVFPAYAAVGVLWLSSLGWLLWRRNRPFA